MEEVECERPEASSANKPGSRRPVSARTLTRPCSLPAGQGSKSFLCISPTAT